MKVHDYSEMDPRSINVTDDLFTGAQCARAKGVEITLPYMWAGCWVILRPPPRKPDRYAYLHQIG